MKRTHIILARFVLAVPLFALFLLLGERAPEMLAFIASAFRKNPLL